MTGVSSSAVGRTKRKYAKEIQSAIESNADSNDSADYNACDSVSANDDACANDNDNTNDSSGTGQNGTERDSRDRLDANRFWGHVDKLSDYISNPYHPDRQRNRMERSSSG